MDLTLKIWRQASAKAKGNFETYKISEISPDCSFLEMLDILNEKLIKEGKEPVAFDHDCREGICGTCSLYINGRPHGPDDDVTTCQLHMRKFKNGDTITVEPWRAGPFPIVKDLVVNRNAFDQILYEGGFISVALDAVLVLQRVKILLPCYLLQLKFRILPFYPKEKLKHREGLKLWLQKWMNWVLVAVQIPVPAKQNARKIFRYPTLHVLIGNFFALLLLNNIFQNITFL